MFWATRMRYLTLYVRSSIRDAARPMPEKKRHNDPDRQQKIHQSQSGGRLYDECFCSVCVLFYVLSNSVNKLALGSWLLHPASCNVVHASALLDRHIGTVIGTGSHWTIISAQPNHPDRADPHCHSAMS